MGNFQLAPLGMDDTQWSELPDGSRKTKFHLTHVQSFEALVGKSVNTRVVQDVSGTIVLRRLPITINPLYYFGQSTPSYSDNIGWEI